MKGLSLDNQKGFLLIGLIITIVVMSIAGAAIVYLTTGSAFTELLQNNNLKAYYLAESGARYATALIQSDLSGGSTVNMTALNASPTFNLATGKFTLVIDNSNSSYILLTSTGIVDSGWLQTKRAVTYKISNPGGAFSEAAMAGLQISLDHGSHIDSYNSSNGAYGGINVSANGNVSTNTGGTVTNKNGSTVNGTITTSSVNLNTLLDANGVAHLVNSENPGGTSSSIQLVSNTLTIPAPATMNLTNFSLDQSSTLIIQGSGVVTIYLNGNLSLDHASILNIASGVTVNIYMTGFLALNNGATMGDTSTDVASRLTVYSSDGSVTLDQNSVFVGAIYAPLAIASLDHGSVVYGAIIANQLSLDNAAQLHYDKSLNLGGSGGGPVQYY